VSEQRWPWLLTAGLMLASAVAAAWSTYLDWLPCRGSMLSGSIIYGYHHVGPDFSDACLRRMDGEQGPRALELRSVAMALAGLAWLALVLGMRWQLRTKAVAALPGLVTLALAGVVAIGAGLGQDDSLLVILRLTLGLTFELLAVVALVAISTGEPDVGGRGVLRLVVVLWGTTAFGLIHVIVEFIVMVKFTEANWDTPPGTGYLTVATITISAILTVIMTLRAPRTVADDEQHQAVITSRV
jgi:hypothetical protein